MQLFEVREGNGTGNVKVRARFLLEVGKLKTVQGGKLCKNI